MDAADKKSSSTTAWVVSRCWNWRAGAHEITASGIGKLSKPIYDYQRDDEDATKPMVLSEVTFHFSPAELRRIACFLAARAEEIEGGNFTEGGRHLGLEDKTWDAESPAT